MAIGISGGAGLPTLAGKIAAPKLPTGGAGLPKSAGKPRPPRPPKTINVTIGTDATKPPKPPKPIASAAPPAAPPAATTPPPASAPVATGTDGSIPPLDATALQNIAANTFKVNNQINALNLQRGNEGTTLQAQLAQLAYQQPRDQLALEQHANQAGSLYSSVEGQNQGNLAYQFAGRQGGLQSNYDQSIARIASEISALQGGIPLYNSDQALGSAGRQSASAAANPPGLAPAPAPAPTAPAPAPSGGKGSGGKGNGKGKGGKPTVRNVTVATDATKAPKAPVKGSFANVVKAIAVKPTRTLKGGGKTFRRPI